MWRTAKQWVIHHIQTNSWNLSAISQTRDAIDKYCEKFETDMLKHFDRYYQRGDPTMMAVSSCAAECYQYKLTNHLLQHCAKVLLDFNGGQSCVQVYVNQHDFFITRSRIADSGAITASPM